MTAALALVALATGCSNGDDPEATMPRITGVVLMTAAPTTTTTLPRSYVVQQGETLSEIAQRFGVDVATLATANGISNPDAIEAGQTLDLAVATALTTTTTAP